MVNARVSHGGSNIYSELNFFTADFVSGNLDKDYRGRDVIELSLESGDHEASLMGDSSKYKKGNYESFLEVPLFEFESSTGIWNSLKIWTDYEDAPINLSLIHI